MLGLGGVALPAAWRVARACAGSAAAPGLRRMISRAGIGSAVVSSGVGTRTGRSRRAFARARAKIALASSLAVRAQQPAGGQPAPDHDMATLRHHGVDAWALA